MDIDIPKVDIEDSYLESKLGEIMLWVITDTHINHTAMINSCGRPKNFSALVCQNWKRMVKSKDAIIHLGDCAWDDKGMEKLLKLPGKKILIRGNHDHKTFQEYMNMGWDFAAESFELKFDRLTILFTHALRWNHQTSINVHGHFHDLHREDFSHLYLPLSLESMGYMPIAIDEAFIATLSAWVRKHKPPTLSDIYHLRQNHRVLTKRDIYGKLSKEEFAKALVSHKLISQEITYDGNADAISAEFGIFDHMIDGLT